ncbi:hypothetical protein Ahy_A09g043023 [Arachis hypogaea]|uniref:CCHC-type domain-containing protein n=1 Tax=Arachis hypogaea TaxID=3818 RepID=A0A445BHB9_ARAHY|nr:hypothetical protein Ahy_A09g043023 [Arachis hypogaea]
MHLNCEIGPEAVYFGPEAGKRSRCSEVSCECKRRGYSQRFPQRRNDLATNRNSQGKGREKQIVAASDVLSCQRCGGHHPNRPCRYGSGLCYNCEKLGHLVRDCPHREDRETARSDFRT